MCGIVGAWSLDEKDLNLGDLIMKMTSTLTHRGPDDVGTWVNNDVGVGLGHCRLSIIDLSSEGHQPMLSNCGRFVIVYNGEVYNYQALRDELEPLGHIFRGHSDTEVILASFVQWGLEISLKKFIGMFAIALWDRKEHSMYLIRDRIGIKPLYYGWVGNTFVVASEMKAICEHPRFNREINRQVVPLFFSYNYIPSPWSIYEGIHVLNPGCILCLKSTDFEQRNVDIKSYWSAIEVAERGINEQFIGSDIEAEEELDKILRDSVKLRMISDVSLGAFLSGGIDSSVVVSLMQAQSTSKIHTYSIGFREEGYNEAIFASEVAKYLGTDHTELYVTPKEAIDVIPKLSEMYDEPFADSSQIPTFLVSSLSQQYVTVALSGDGGDELFYGYPRYEIVNRLWSLRNVLPHYLRQMAAKILLHFDEKMYNRMFSFLKPILQRMGYTANNLGGGVHHTARSWRINEFGEFYNQYLLLWPILDDLLKTIENRSTVMTDPARQIHCGNTAHKLMYYDLVQYLPDDILTKVDRASMGVSLEVRVPIIDHRVVEFAWSLPLRFKLRDGKEKWLLRNVLNRYVPKNLIDRPKMGFGVPIGQWLKSSLRDWAEELLSPKALDDGGFFQLDIISQIWQEHLEGIANHQYRLWPILMFQSWRKRWLKL